MEVFVITRSMENQMVKGDFKNRCRLTVFFFCFTVMLTVCVNTSPAAEVSPPAGTEQLFSPSVAQLFLDMAYEEANSENYRQALAFLNAMMNLDVRSNCPVSDTINIACMDTREDRSGTVLELLNSYMDKTIDMEVIRKAVQYLMDRLSSREEREVLLVKLLKQAGEKNLVLNSELSTLLGLLIAEKADIETAQAYFMQAYKNNKYNS